ncbi:hypothetical protein [Polaromonas sp. C04]|uniref:hypothetical protein n=1 Tax=Polaromonas sp. C04 TaxID=1945857 RepID=UPI0011862624|nr:hypothetical protein [Polaromonas sp. C04]
MHFLYGFMLFLSIGLVHAQDVPGCGSLENGYGPFGYRKASKETIQIFEKFHFTPKIEYLIPGRNKEDYFGGDISYTPRAFPNHYRALITIQRLANRETNDSPSHAEFSVTCYSDRVIRFQLDAPIVRMLFVRYLIKKARTEEATRQLDGHQPSRG